MNEDPIVKEVRDIRAKLFAQCDNDLGKLMDFYASQGKKYRHRHVTPEEVRRRSEASARREREKHAE